MKLSTKIFLPIILISALLILLSGCFLAPSEEQPALTLYTVIYNRNGSDVTGTVPVDANLYKEGDLVTVLGNTGTPALVNTDYDFYGWNTAADGSGISLPVGYVFAMVTSDVTLYAMWDLSPGFTAEEPPIGGGGGFVGYVDPCAGNTAPVIDEPLQDSIYEISALCDLEIPIVVTDDGVNGPGLYFSLDTGPGMLDTADGVAFKWSPDCKDVGEYKVTISVTDECDDSDSVDFTVKVTNSTPKIDPIDPVEVAALCCIDPIQIVASDPDEPCQSLKYTIESVPKNSMYIKDGYIYWCPSCDEIGDYKVTVTVTDDCGSFASTSFGASATNDEPKIQSIDDVKVAALCCIDPIQVVASDQDEPCQTLTYSLSYEGATDKLSMTIDKKTGLIEWCPTCDEIGDYCVTVTVTDNCCASASTSFTATAYNNPPVITDVEFENEWTWWQCECYYVVIEDSKTLHIKVTADDADDCQTLTFSLNAEVGDYPLPPVGLMYEPVGNNEFDITFNANCYDECIQCEPDLERTGRDKGDWFCDCWWEFIVRVTDGCETEDVCIRICVADLIQ